MKQYPHIQLVIALSLIAVAVSYMPVRAYTDPSTAFPNGNPATLLTTGSKAETKTGNLTVGYFSAWQNALFGNQVSIGGILRGDEPGAPTVTSTLNIGGTDLSGSGSNVTRTMSLTVTKGNTKALSFLSPTLITTATGGTVVGGASAASSSSGVTITSTSITSVDSALCADGTGTIVLCGIPAVAVADFCKNIAATTALPTGMYKDTDGNCYISACSNMNVQAVPATMFKDTDGGCYVSACTNKNVRTVPSGEVKNTDGSCSAPVVDFCSNIANSTSLPAGFIKMSDGGCYQIPNVANLQITMTHGTANDVVTGSMQLDSSLLSDTTFTVKLLIKTGCQPSQINGSNRCGSGTGPLISGDNLSIPVSATKGMKQIPISFTTTKYINSLYIPVTNPVQTKCIQIDSPSSSEIPLLGSFHC